MNKTTDPYVIDSNGTPHTLPKSNMSDSGTAEHWQCRACGGTGGHWEGCRGEAELAIENAALTAEVVRLKRICEIVHDRLLRCDPNAELLDMLQRGWRGELEAK